MDTDTYDPQRPRCLEDMAGSSEWTPLKTMLKAATPPHLIVAGPIGIGKSLAIRNILGTEIALWFQCTKDPTLKPEIRERIKTTARRRIKENSIHWIVLEHADMLHSDAQAFLRRVIETSTGASRFILEARNLSGISEPLLSRATIFNAPVLLPYEIRAEVQKRCNLPTSVCNLLAEQSDGSIRWAVLQGLYGMAGMAGMADAGYISPLVSSKRQTQETHWQYVLRLMEEIQATGTNPRALIKNTDGWDRPGGICPWAITATKIALLDKN